MNLVPAGVVWMLHFSCMEYSKPDNIPERKKSIRNMH